MNMTERPPLQPAEKTFIDPFKDNTQIRRHLLRLADFASVLLTLDRILGDEDASVAALCASWGPYICIHANDEKHSRFLAGRLMRAFYQKPKIQKVGDDELESVFTVDGVSVSIRGYKPKTCRYEERDVVIPATEEKVEVTAAQPERVERRRVLVCDEPIEEPAAPEPVPEDQAVPF